MWMHPCSLSHASANLRSNTLLVARGWTLDGFYYSFYSFASFLFS